MNLREALAIRGRLISLEGGPVGLRDVGLLQCALAPPQQLRAYGDKPDMAALAAAYMTGIVRDHPFVDGNKRAGFTLGVVFAEMNGYRFTGAEESSTQIILSLAARELDEPSLADWIRSNIKREKIKLTRVRPRLQR